MSFSVSSRSYGSTASKADDRESTSKRHSVKAIPGEKDTSGRLIRAINLGLICLGLFFYGMCLSVYAPFFPPEAEKRGLSATLVGFILGTWQLVMCFGCIISGRLSGHLGRRFMIAAGFFLEASTTILFGVLDKSPHGDAYIVLCFANRFIEGFGASMFNNAAFSTAALLYPDSIATVYAILQTADGLGRIVGPSIGGLLYSAGGFSLPFVVLGGCLLIVGIITVILLQASLFSKEEEAPPKDPKQAEENRPWRHFYAVSIDMWILATSLTTSALIAGYSQPTMSVYFVYTLGFQDPTIIGLVYLGGGLAFAVLSVVIGKITDTFPKHFYLIMIAGSILLFASHFFMGPSPFLQSFIEPSVGLVTACYIVSCIGVAFLLNPVPSAILRAARSAGYKEGLELSAMVASLFNAHWFLGGFAGNPIAGVLFDSVGFSWGAFIMSMLALALTALVVFGYIRRLYKDYKARRALDRAVLYQDQKVTTAPRPSQWVVAPGI